jgi:thymidine kinase
MFSGKTEEFIRRIKRVQFANQKVKIFKPSIDSRYDKDRVVSHNNNSINSTPINNPNKIKLHLDNVDVIGIDEAQFFDMDLVNVCTEIANKGIRVIVAGLDMDFKGNPFGPIPSLMAIAENVTKVHAICLHCGNDANHSHRLINNKKLMVLGEKENYQPLCRNCFNKANK